MCPFVYRETTFPVFPSHVILKLQIQYNIWIPKDKDTQKLESAKKIILYLA